MTQQKKNPMYYYLRKNWKINAEAFLLCIAQSAGETMFAVVMMNVMQAIIDMDGRAFLIWMGLEEALILFERIVVYARNCCMASAINQMNGCLRRDMGYSLLQMQHMEFHSKQTGEYLSQFTDDINQIEQLAWKPLFQLIATISGVAMSMAVLVSLHWSLLAASVAAGIVMLLAPRAVQKKLEALSKQCAQAQALATGKLKDLLSGFDVLRFFSRERRFLEGIEEANSQIEDNKKQRTYKQSLWNLIINYVCNLSNDATIVLVGILSVKGIIPASALFGTGNLTSAVYSSFQELSGIRLSLISAKPYFEKIKVHADEAAALPAEKPMEPVRRGIEIKSLDFAYTDKPVLEKACFTFEKGKKYALTGPSGCGKSTVLKLLLGWLPDYTGQILLDGRDAREYTPEQLQQQMSYIEQDVFLFNSTIRDNITLGERFTDEEMEKALRGSALEGDLVNMPQGLDTPVGEDGSCLSGGQKQRVAIARALIHNRSILLVDEGTSALDQKNADIVEKSLLGNPSLTLILVSHHLSEERKAQFDKVYTLEPAPSLVS